MTTPTSMVNPSAPPISHYWFRQGTSRFAVRTSDLLGVATLPVVRPLPLADPSLVGFGLYQGRVLPVFDPVSLAGLALDRISQPVRVAAVAVQGRPALAFLCSEAGCTVDLAEADLVPAAGCRPAAFRGEHPFGKDFSLLVLDPPGLAQSFGLLPSRSS